MNRQARRKPLSDPGPPLSPLPPTEQPTPAAIKWILPVLLIAYLCLATAHLMILPTGQTGYQNAPDEAAHVAYIHALTRGHFPTRKTPLAPGQEPAPGYEWHQPPLYYLLAAAFNPLGVRALRFASILCGLLALWLIYRTLRLAYPERPLLAVLATGIAALTPTHIAITSAVNNDALLEVFFSATLLALLGSFHGGFTTRRAFWLGAAISGAILTKMTGLLLLPISLFGVFLFWRSGESPRTLMRGVAIALGTIVALTGWWFVRNQLLYGEPLPLRGFAAEFAGTRQAADVVAMVGGWGNYLIGMGIGIFQSFWAVYGRPKDLALGQPRFLPDTVYLLMALISITAAAGVTRLHFRRRQEFTQSQIYTVWIFCAAAGLVAASFLAFILKYAQMQGRYLFPAMLPLCFLLALGWLGVFPRRYQGAATAFLLAFMAVLCIVFLVSL